MKGQFLAGLLFLFCILEKQPTAGAVSVFPE